MVSVGEIDMIVREEIMEGVQVVLMGGHQVHMEEEDVEALIMVTGVALIMVTDVALIMVTLEAQFMISTAVQLMTDTGALNMEGTAGIY